MKEYLTTTPKRPQGDNLYELKGRQRGIWQFKVSRSRGIRLFYRVDDDARVVRIEALRAHPSWARSRDEQGL